MSINIEMDKEDVVHINNEILLSHKKRLLAFNLTQRMSIRIEDFAHAVPKPRMFCYNSNPIHSSLSI